MTSVRRFLVASAATVLALGLGLDTLQAQTPKVFFACYGALTGVVYRIKEPGIPANCLHPSHIQFSWTDGAEAIRTGATAGGDLTGTYPNPTIANNAVTASKLADNTIDNADIINNSLDATSLATGSVGSDEILDNTIDNSDILDNSLDASSLTTGAVASDEILDGSITADDIAPGVVSGDGSCRNGCVNTAAIADGAVTGPKIANDAVTGTKIADGSITAADLATGALSSIQSPNGLFGLSITNTGIELTGPGGRVAISATGIELVTSSAALRLQPSGTTLTGVILRLNCGGDASGFPVARMHDMVSVPVGGGPGIISAGSTTVLAC